jgi:hypothetical protein
MKRVILVFVTMLMYCSLAAEEPVPETSAAPGVKTLSGMSVLGNNEAPKSLVIVPWKSSRMGDGVSMHELLDERASPVDREVFARELGYYEVRTGGPAYSQSGLLTSQ